VRAAVSLAVHGAAVVLLAASAGCDDGYSAEIDSFPIALTRAPLGSALAGIAGEGALVATAAAPDAHDQSFAMLVELRGALLASGSRALRVAIRKAALPSVKTAYSSPSESVRESGSLSRIWR